MFLDQRATDFVTDIGVISKLGRNNTFRGTLEMYNGVLDFFRPVAMQVDRLSLMPFRGNRGVSGY